MINLADARTTVTTYWKLLLAAAILLLVLAASVYAFVDARGEASRLRAQIKVEKALAETTADLEAARAERVKVGEEVDQLRRVNDQLVQDNEAATAQLVDKRAKLDRITRQARQAENEKKTIQELSETLNQLGYPNKVLP